jgi:neutral amino acid transport system permease protein
VRTRAAQALLLAFVTAVFAMLLPAATASAVAGDHEPPSSPLAAGVPGLVMQGGGEVVQGQVRGEDGEGVPGVTITVEGDGFSEEIESDDEGRWRVELPGPGAYTVTLDEESLPEGASLRNPDRNPLEVQVSGGQQRAALFPLGESTRETVGTVDRLLQTSASGLRFGLVLALAAVGLSLIFGTTGLTNFAHGELLTLGALIAFFFSSTLGWSLLLAALMALLLSGAFGYALDLGLWSRLRKRGTGLIAMMIVSIGLAIFMRYFFLYIFGGGRQSLRTGEWLGQVVAFGPVRFRTLDLVSMGICVVAIGAVAYALLRTRLGKATRAVSDNPALASATGIDVERVIRVVWVAGAALAGLSGVMLGGIIQINFALGQQALLLIFAAVTLGGLGTAFGALVGALIVGLLVEMSVLVLPAELKYVAALAILIIVLLIRPQGILGRRERIG